MLKMRQVLFVLVCVIAISIACMTIARADEPEATKTPCTSWECETPPLVPVCVSFVVPVFVVEFVLFRRRV